MRVLKSTDVGNACIFWNSQLICSMMMYSKITRISNSNLRIQECCIFENAKERISSPTNRIIILEKRRKFCHKQWTEPINVSAEIHHLILEQSVRTNIRKLRTQYRLPATNNTTTSSSHHQYYTVLTNKPENSNNLKLIGDMVQSKWTVKSRVLFISPTKYHSIFSSMK